MTDKEYLERNEAIFARYTKDRFKLAMDYVKANTPYHKGDIIKDDCGAIIQIEKIRINTLCNDDLPSWVYIGPTLTKALTLRKHGYNRTIPIERVIAKLN